MKITRTLAIVAAAICAATFIPSCGSDSIKDIVNDFSGNKLYEITLPSTCDGRTFTITSADSTVTAIAISGSTATITSGSATYTANVVTYDVVKTQELDALGTYAVEANLVLKFEKAQNPAFSQDVEMTILFDHKDGSFATVTNGPEATVDGKSVWNWSAIFNCTTRSQLVITPQNW